MSYKTRLIKLVLNKTPRKAVLWAVNKKLKEVGELTDFSFNTDDRKLYVKIMLEGEIEPIDVKLEEFTVTTSGESGYLTIQQVQSNRAWVNTLLNKLLQGREWRIPDSKLALVQEIFEPKD
jgi:hypothetical protein